MGLTFFVLEIIKNFVVDMVAKNDSEPVHVFLHSISYCVLPLPVF